MLNEVAKQTDTAARTRRCADSDDGGRADRLAVVAAARDWLGTPYHHAADVRGSGVDCAMILVRVFCDLGLTDNFDPRPYTRDWFLHRDEERYMGHLLARAHEVTNPQPGDVMLFKIGRCYAHGGIVTKASPLTIVHAFAAARYVVEDEVRRTSDLAEKPCKFFSYWPQDPPQHAPLSGLDRRLPGSLAAPEVVA